ncbi:MAG: hypothetical protein AB7E52_03575 [Bdellovibrionales bacterium]
MAKRSTECEKFVRFRTWLLAAMVMFIFSPAHAADLSPEGDLSDLASFWLHFLFKGGSQSAGPDILNTLAAALRQAMHAYSMAMFTLGGFLLLAQVVGMIAETAHTGVLMGRRANQVWAPIRLLLGITLLIPAGSGLGLGQSLIVKLAAAGSDLASQSWNYVLEQVGPNAADPVPPHLPDLARFVTVSIENELCRSIYDAAVTAAAADEIVAAAGEMPDLLKKAAGQLEGETWSYTNVFFPQTALCGAYRLFSPSVQADGTLNGAESFVAESARASAERLAYQALSVTKGVGTHFLLHREATEPSVTVKESLAGFVTEQTELMESKQTQILRQWSGSETTSLWRTLAANGWIGAGSLPFVLSRTQMTFGALANQAVPQVKAPLFGHEALTLEAWDKAARQALFLPLGTSVHFENYDTVFYRINDAMRRARNWLYGTQVRDVQSVLPDQSVMTDLFGPYADNETAQTAIARMAGIGASSFGLFARAPQIARTTKVREPGEQSISPTQFAARPFQSLAELGSRYMGYGSWLIGMLGPALFEKTTVGTAAGFYLVALTFLMAGACLLFAVPFIPFFRFIIAVASWALAVIGAILSLPLVALAHLYPAGEGLAGPMARQAYWLWLGLFLRPVLILLGFLGGLLLFMLSMLFVNALLLEWLAPLVAAHGLSFWGVRTALSLLYALTALVLSYVCFKGIVVFPSLLTRWINLQSPLPESVVIAPHGLPPQASMEQGLSPLEGAAALSPLSPMERLAQKFSREQDKPAPAYSMQAARNAAQAAQFPHLPEQKAAQRAQAHAQAFAKAESLQGGKGGEEKIAMAAAAASSSGTDQEVKAMAISRHMIPDAKEDKEQKDFKSSLLSPDDHDLPQASKKKPDQEKEESAEQESATPIAPENNPYALPEEKEKE